MSLAYKISAWNRDRKWRLFLDKIKPTKETKILDVGFNEIEYSATDNYLEKNYEYPENITALGFENSQGKEFTKRYPRVKAIYYQGGRFPFADQFFDLCWSNAVLEHVGSREKQTEFLREIKRTAKRAFITTPNRYFPIEIHTRLPLLHFLPKVFFDWFARLIGKGWASGDYMNLLSLSELKQLLKSAGIENYQIYKNKFLGFTMDFVVIF
jgi:SAM-dependent methyltransferase